MTSALQWHKEALFNQILKTKHARNVSEENVSKVLIALFNFKVNK